MEKHIISQGLAADQLLRLQTNFRASDAPKTASFFRNYLKAVSTLYDNFLDTHQKIISSLSGNVNEIENSYFKNSEITQFQESYITFHSELEELLLAATPEPHSVSELKSTHHNRDSEVKLPRISLPQFEGDYSTWSSFKDLFVSLIHCKESLSKVEKLHYLKCSLKGEAESLLKSYQITESNYDAAWKTLLERYDNKGALLNNQFKTLVSTDSVSESSIDIKNLLDRTMEAVRLLESMEVDNLWHALVVFLVVQRLPQQTRQLWEQQQATKVHAYSLEDLKTFLHTRFRALEATGVKTPYRRINAHYSESKLECSACKQGHKLRFCPKFENATQSQRFDMVKSFRLCLNCLSRGHNALNCPTTVRCLKCKGLHHTMLHRDVKPSSDCQRQDSFPSTTAIPFVPNDVNSLSGIITSNVLLATASVTVLGEGGAVKLRALLDQGSQASFMTEDAVQQLGLRKKPCDAIVTGIGKISSLRSRGLVDASIKTLDDEHIAFQAFVLTNLANLLPASYVRLPCHSELVEMQLADPNFNVPGRISMIIGADVYGRLLMKNSKLLFGGLLLQQTKLGWIISGNTQHPSDTLIQSFKLEITEEPSLDRLLENFWRLEEPIVEKLISPEDQKCEAIYKTSTSRDESGRFIVRLPFMSDLMKNKLGSSRRSAELSFLSLERRFERNPQLQIEYTDCINEYLRLGYLSPVDKIEEITYDSGGNRCHAHYLPHHAVRKDSSTTKTRIVFDASRKTTSGLSLNDVLFTGPSIQNCMSSVLMRWRLNMLAYAADIEKMFPQIKLHENDKDYQRIVWRFNPHDEIQDYRFNRLVFGVTSSPFLAIRSLMQLAIEGEAEYPRAAKSLEYDFYVDDLIADAANREEAKLNIFELRKLLTSGGFHLRKWLSNDPSILQDIPVEDIEAVNILDLDFDQGHKSLGIIWHPGTDTISYRHDMPDHQSSYTKRTILSDIARLYDPLGWIAPIMINAKCLMQDLWKLGIDWDETLPTNIIDSWKEIKNSFVAIDRIRLPRCISIGNTETFELHGFCDASLEAYGAAVYSVSRGDHGTTVRLALAKAKVSPVKPEVISRLELCGAVLLAKLIKQYVSAVSEHVSITNIYLWSDNKTVLAWLRKHPSNWQVFVANRSCQILELVPNIPWRYVPSESNPADIVSRGMDSEKLSNSRLWWNGPEWLSLPEEQWPSIIEIEPTTLEAKPSRRVKCYNACAEETDMDKLIKKFSSLTRLVRVTAYCRRFFQIALKRVANLDYLTAQELIDALMFWIVFVQRKEFDEEISCLQRKLPLKKGNRLAKLNPFVDGHGILRVGGRLTHASMSFREKHPIILPKTGKLTDLVIDQTHKLTIHGQAQLMLAALGTKYWILNARNLVKNHIHNCIKCHKMKAQTSSQLMGSLPTARVNISRPFTHVGVDYCGPVNIKDRNGRGARTHKGYFAVFVCLVVKAIHIEIVNDMTTESFLAAFRRFVSRRGLCSDVYSDCGTNFIGADAELRRIVNANRRIFKDAANLGIKWHFNPPASPHFGGLWEAGVKSMKNHLRRTLGDVPLTYEELSTTIAQIEACLNSRPLCPMTDDPTDASALTPAHFLIGDTLLNVPESDLLDLSLNYLSRWQLTQRLSQMFWNRWSRDYLMRLQQRPKWLSQQVNPKIGDLCLLKDERLPSYKWPLARIVAIHPGKDNLVRVVSVVKNGNTFKRNITKIALLPISN